MRQIAGMSTAVRVVPFYILLFHIFLNVRHRNEQKRLQSIKRGVHGQKLLEGCRAVYAGHQGCPEGGCGVLLELCSM